MKPAHPIKPSSVKELGSGTDDKTRVKLLISIPLSGIPASLLSPKASEEAPIAKVPNSSVTGDASMAEKLPIEIPFVRSSKPTEISSSPRPLRKTDW